MIEGKEIKGGEMKSIKVADEMYNFLMELSKKMNTQDNRATASPFMYIIAVDEERPVPMGNGETKLIDDEGIEWDLEQAKEDYETEIREYFKVDSKKILSDAMVEEYLKDTREARKVSFCTEMVPASGLNVNTFFTEDAVRRHIKQNYYHYNNPVDFLIHAWRNYEMEMVHKFLKELSKEEKDEKNI